MSANQTARLRTTRAGMLAVRPPGTAFASPPEFWFRPTLDAFRYTFVSPGRNAPQLLNSLIVSSAATLLSLPFALSAAYALSRFRLRFKRALMLWYISLLMAPPIVFLIPYFILMTRIDWAGSYQAMALILQTVTIPFSVWLLKSFMDEVPRDLEEDLVFPLVLSRHTTATLPVGTLNYFATSGITWNYIAAAAVAAMLPPMLIFLLLGRYIVRGLTLGAVKG